MTSGSIPTIPIRAPVSAEPTLRRSVPAAWMARNLNDVDRPDVFSPAGWFLFVFGSGNERRYLHRVCMAASRL
jgi:hypothetical protein